MCKSNVERPTYVDYIVNVYGAAQCINFNLGITQSRLVKRFCKQKVNYSCKMQENFLTAVLLALPDIFQH